MALIITAFYLLMLIISHKQVALLTCITTGNQPCSTYLKLAWSCKFKVYLYLALRLREVKQLIS